MSQGVNYIQLLQAEPLASQPVDDGDYQSQSTTHSVEDGELSQFPSPVPSKVQQWNDTLWTDHQRNLNLLGGIKSVRHGWCELVTMKTSKKDLGLPLDEQQGYIQLSLGGFNHVCLNSIVVCVACLYWNVKNIMLQRLVAIATTREVPNPGDEASHLCHHTVCKTVGHVIWEPSLSNQRRKGCPVWVKCPHECDKLVDCCTHDPKCIKAIPGLTEEEFIADRHLYMH